MPIYLTVKAKVCQVRAKMLGFTRTPGTAVRAFDVVVPVFNGPDSEDEVGCVVPKHKMRPVVDALEFDEFVLPNRVARSNPKEQSVVSDSLSDVSTLPVERLKEVVGEEDSDDTECVDSNSLSEVSGGWVDDLEANVEFDSLIVSEESDSAEPQPIRDSKPPLPRGALAGPLAQRPPSNLDGKWTLCSPKGNLSDWLDAFTISGDEVVDGVGKVATLRTGPKGPRLAGGRLCRKGAALCRLGRSGHVQVYLRQEGC